MCVQDLGMGKECVCVCVCGVISDAPCLPHTPAFEILLLWQLLQLSSQTEFPECTGEKIFEEAFFI